MHIDDSETLERITELAIPPAWREVWICMDPLGHLQATGVDSVGRKQYLYHERWRAHRDRLKFDSMTSFGQMLPRLRRRVRRDLASEGDGLSSQHVLACAVRLLDLGFFRIGSEDYAERNESYGLTTMLRRHVSIEDGEVIFDFPAKSGRRRVQAIADPDVLEVITALKQRRGGKQLLAHRAGGSWTEVRAEDVNSYIKEVAHDARVDVFRSREPARGGATTASRDADEGRPGRGRARKRREMAGFDTFERYVPN